MRTRNVVLGCLLFALVFGYAVIGSLLYTAPIGLAPTAFPAGEAIQKLFPNAQYTVAGAVWIGLALIGLGFLCFFLVRAAVRGRVAETDPDRRSFLTGAASGAGAAVGGITLGFVAAGARAFFGLGHGGRGWKGVGDNVQAKVEQTAPEWKEEWKGSRVAGYRRFGRTEFQVSDIVLGTGRIREDNRGEEIARAALDRGVNYFDTSPDYSGSGSENAMGKAIQGVRSQLFIATKFCTPTGHLPAGTPVEKYIEAVEASLGRLGTDYVDLCHIHSCDQVDRLMDPNVHEAFDRLKEAGKVRFLGFSSHTPNLVEVAEAGIDSGRFDVMMLAYHHGLWRPMDDLIRRAREEQDMGVVAMKTLKGAKHHGLEGFRTERNSFAQAGLKWALSNPDVSCAVISFFELQHVDEYLKASGQSLTRRDLEILEKYDRLVAGTYCHPHCGECLDHCPEGLPIHDVLRHRMYFEDYGWEKEGMQRYAELERDASVCASCSAPCTGSCPVGIPIQERMTGAHELLTLT